MLVSVKSVEKCASFCDCICDTARGIEPKEITVADTQADFLEARVGIEPTRKGFADLSLTTWVPRRQLLSISKIQARLQSRALRKLRYFFAVVPIRASRRK